MNSPKTPKHASDPQGEEGGGHYRYVRKPTSHALLVMLRIYPGPHAQDVTVVAPADTVVDPEGHARHDGSEPPPPCDCCRAHGMEGGGYRCLCACLSGCGATVGKGRA